MNTVYGWGGPRLRPVLALAGWYLVIQTLLRIVLWAAFGRETGVGAWQLVWVLPAGVVSDAIEAVYLLLPWALLLWLVPERWYVSRGFHAFVSGSVFVWMGFLTFAAIAEYYFFDEFNARFNLVSVDYLIYPTEVVGDIRDEYPLKTVGVIVLLVTVLSFWLLRRSLRPAAQPGYGWKQRGRLFAAYTVLLVIVIVGFSSDTLGFSGNRVTNELAANGGSSFFRALRTSDIDYTAFYATRDAKQNLALLTHQLGTGGGEFTRLAEGRLDRHFPARSDGFGKLNVVVLASESFGAEFSKLYGSERDWTPEFDAFAQQGLWFRHMYASGTRTVRGLEAVTASFPPIPSDSIVRRPGNENIATWGRVMRGQGYGTSFLYGGYGYFDNMNAFYAANGFEVRDRNAIEGPLRFGNVWGVSDEDLYDMALAYYDRQSTAGKPFFSIIMNTSNHKPFTFREGVPGVKAKDGGRESGVRYADFATGYLLREAAKHKWFDDTIFVVVADHGARVYGRADIPLKSYEIPLLIYSPKHVRPGVVESLTGQIDIPPTVLAMLGLPYTAPFFGQDALHTPDADRIALFSHNHDVALLKGDKLAILGLQREVRTLQYDKQNERYTPLPHDPELENLAIAYYQTAFEQYRAHTYE